MNKTTTAGIRGWMGMYSTVEDLDMTFVNGYMEGSEEFGNDM